MSCLIITKEKFTIKMYRCNSNVIHIINHFWLLFSDVHLLISYKFIIIILPELLSLTVKCVNWNECINIIHFIVKYSLT